MSLLLIIDTLTKHIYNQYFYSSNLCDYKIDFLKIKIKKIYKAITFSIRFCLKGAITHL